MSPAKVVLVGPRGAGKSTVGRALARRLGWGFQDGDDLLAAAAGMPAGDYLGQAGEAAFRQLEERVTLAALAEPGRTVLALGGGAVLSAAVRERLQQTALWTVFLTAPAAVLAARVAASSTPRPPLTQLPPAAEAAAILRARMPLYGAVARQTLDTARRGVDAVAAGIVEGMRAAGRG